MQEEIEALEDCLQRLPHSAPEAAGLVRRILPTLEKWSYAEQTGRFLLEHLQLNQPGCENQLAAWLAELRNPGQHRHYALPGAPPPPS